MDDSEAMRAAELGELGYMEAMYAGADPAVRDALGMAHARVGGGLVCVMAHDPTGGFWNRVLGLGIDQPLTDEVIEEVLSFGREHDAPRLAVQVAPGADPVGWGDLLARHGLNTGGSWVKFVAPRGFRVEATTDVTIERIGPERGSEFAQVMCEGFGMPRDSPLPDWFAQMPGMADLTTYAAVEHGRMLATAVLCVRDGLASLCGAATLSAARGRGLQSALMARRVDDANTLGAAWIATETGTETPENPNPSLHNMRRLGFTELYERRNWIWSPAA